MNTQHPSLPIDVVSDVVCPWCYIGKRRLERALALRRAEAPAFRAQVAWHPFELNPGVPESGVERQAFYRRKFGDEVDRVIAHVTEAGRSAGLDFHFDRIERQPNTTAMHALIAHAGNRDLQDALVEALFRAFFVDGVDLGDPVRIAATACSAGLAESEVEAVLANAAAREHVRVEQARARELGVQGVPFFVFDGRVAVSGAQLPETLLAAMREAASG
jgi:predicted DsbA family dithiol-disulfide isomerase